MMRIDEQTRQCISFLFQVTEGADGKQPEFWPVGTAFYVGINVGRDRVIKYAITARHVIEQSRNHSPLCVRCMGPNGEKRLFELPHDAWWVHPSSDVAAVQICFPLEEYGFKFLPIELFADDQWLREHDVGIGDRLIIPGMFTQFVGDVRDEPLIRFGQIALMPNEKIKIQAGGGMPEMEVESIFAEAAAWGGQSGSPAFVYFSIDRGLFAGEALQLKIPNPRLLGLIHGHYLFREPLTADLDVPINAGIAIIIPCKAIRELLMSEQVVAVREEVKQILREEGLID